MLALLGVALVLTWAAGGRRPPSSPDGGVWWAEPVVTLLAYGIAGAVLVDRRPDLPFGWLLGGTAVLVAAAYAVLLPSYEALAGGSDSALPRWGLTASSLLFLPIAVQGLVNVRFPSGRPSGRSGALLEKALLVGTGLVLLGGLLGSSGLGELPGVADVRHPLTGGTTVGAVADGLIVLAPVVVLLGLLAGFGIVVRFRRATGLERQQLQWRASGVVVATALFPLAVTGHIGPVAALDPAVFVLTLAVPVLRHRLWAIDTVLRRSAAYATVTAVLVGVYAGATALAARLAPEPVAAPFAAVVVALLFAPLRSRAQRAVDRLFYGDRSNPYRTLSQLLRQLPSLPQEQQLTALVETVAASLRLPHVAVHATDGRALAATGTPGWRQSWPLVYEGQVEGYLVASPRRTEDGFDDRDSALLQDVALQTGVVVRAQTLTAALLLSRQGVVTAREEERRRLRRDLHDGLGPVLTAVGLHLDAARERLTSDPPAAARHLGSAKDATSQAMADLRRVVHGLRPPALDELGLVGALRAQGERLQGDAGVQITVEADPLPELPAAVEVAAYRTAVEAMTNSVRHGDVRSCRIRLQAGAEGLVVEAHDDGASTAPWVPGVGLTAMRERAAELDGILTAGPTPSGASVTVQFPLPAVRG